MSTFNGFAIIPIDLARTPALSAQSKAVYVALTSHCQDESITLRQLAKEVGTTPEATKKALTALYARGWGDLLTHIGPAVIEDES
ncbi:hypothetical protein [Microbacterium sp. YY-01]|uniref:hypothetical protein n=1 Tax=Microbacterium sp. YY-01 TaxID=3421634 RepID=UPI003D17CDF6